MAHSSLVENSFFGYGSTGAVHFVERQVLFTEKDEERRAVQKV